MTKEQARTSILITALSLSALIAVYAEFGRLWMLIATLAVAGHLCVLVWKLATAKPDAQPEPVLRLSRLQGVSLVFAIMLCTAAGTFGVRTGQLQIAWAAGALAVVTAGLAAAWRLLGSKSQAAA